MIKKPARRDQTGFGPIDYGLMALGSCFGVYSAGMAIGAAESGLVFVVLMGLGTLVSVTIRHFFGTSKFLQFDALLYTVSSICAVVFTPQLNGILPADGIPQDVTTAGWLCWMLTFGSFLIWRDRTLLFQAVPTIALFGLIGCYDTYPPAPFLFFGFLLCLATLLGRSHSRDMLRMAVQSGYFNRGESLMTVSEQPEQSPELYEAIKRGPWRWLAGPEWALLSGLVIVFFSVLGAPIIRQAVQPISGAMRVLAPRRLRTSPSYRSTDLASSYTVGRGPLQGQKMPPVAQFSARLDRMRYLRTQIFENYTGRGWNSSPESEIGRPAAARLTEKSPFEIRIDLLTNSNSVPLPAEVPLPPEGVFVQPSGAAISTSPTFKSFKVVGVESKTQPVAASRDVPRNQLQADLNEVTINTRVRKFAENACANATTDFDRAKAIETAIGERCSYYLGASAVPEGEDSADYFLNNSRQGYCDLFATAMVECARAVHIPAHFCIGYLPESKNTDGSGNTVIYDKDYHAWAELYFQGTGWVVFDATSGAKEIDPEKGDKTAGWLSDALPVILDVLIGAGAFILVGGLVYSSIKSRRRSPGRNRTEAEKLYAQFARNLGQNLGERRQINETADEYLLRIEPDLGPARDASFALNESLMAALYSSETPDDAQLARLRSDLGEILRQLSRFQKESRKNSR